MHIIHAVGISFLEPNFNPWCITFWYSTRTTSHHDNPFCRSPYRSIRCYLTFCFPAWGLCYGESSALRFVVADWCLLQEVFYNEDVCQSKACRQTFTTCRVSGYHKDHKDNHKSIEFIHWTIGTPLLWHDANFQTMPCVEKNFNAKFTSVTFHHITRPITTSHTSALPTISQCLTTNTLQT